MSRHKSMAKKQKQIQIQTLICLRFVFDLENMKSLINYK